MVHNVSQTLPVWDNLHPFQPAHGVSEVAADPISTVVSANPIEKGGWRHPKSPVSSHWLIQLLRWVCDILATIGMAWKIR